ncbi:hypothetical protein H5410_016631 [Solanum commersonii]|uniref:Phosphoglucomutase n=1 Tax=Solanum commersonii TaxID=4109 RepID=A0A9J5ZY78_SOLCO|nr:hypothetical protein H5410_016631 [Solanum commersonii]
MGHGSSFDYRYTTSSYVKSLRTGVGTGSAGATVRIYIEQFEPDVSKHDMDAQIALKPLIDLALSVSKLKDFTGREKPTVIT